MQNKKDDYLTAIQVQWICAWQACASIGNSMNSKLRSCDDCGGKVSKRAATCPHCGAPQDHRDEIVDEIEEKLKVTKEEIFFISAATGDGTEYLLKSLESEIYKNKKS